RTVGRVRRSAPKRRSFPLAVNEALRLTGCCVVWPFAPPCAEHPRQPREQTMPVYKAPVDEVLFLLEDVFQIARYDNLSGFADASPDVLEPILREVAKLCEQVVQPLNRPGDEEGCIRCDDGSVSTPKGFKAAYNQYTAGGWMGISAPPEFGGQGLPATMTSIINEMLASANMAFAMYPGLTQGAIAAILRHGSPEQKAAYLPKLV